MARTGTAGMPLHGGHVPRWLGDRMTALGRVLTEAIVLEYGRDEWLRRVSHPFSSSAAIKRLDEEVRRVDRIAHSDGKKPGGPSLEQCVARARAASHAYGGMSVFGPSAPFSAPAPLAANPQAAAEHEESPRS